MNSPIKLTNGQTVNIREPKVRDMMAIDNIQGNAKRELALVSTLTELPEEELLDFTMQDYGKLQKVVQGFLGLK